MKNITYIIPLNEFNATVETYLEKALNSIKEMKNTCPIILVGPNNVLSHAEIICDTVGLKNKVTLVNNSDPCYQTQINKGVMSCVTEYFTVLEFDDTFYKYWFDVVERYIATGKYSMFIPLTEYVDTDGEFKSFANEIALSNSFANEQGILDIECLEAYMDYSVSGSVIKTETFISNGMLKKSLGIACWYEYLLRACHNDNGVIVIPSVGYKHTINRDGSYQVEEQKRITKKEGEWLVNTARQEYFFNEDRNKTFNG